MKLAAPGRGVFGNTSQDSCVWKRDGGVDTILARQAGGARLLRADTPAWVQARGRWGEGTDADYSIRTAAGALDPLGATEWTAGAGHHTAYLGRLRWDASVPPPAGSACWDTDPDTGLHVLVLDRQSGHGLAIYRPDGVLVGTLDIPVSWARLRDGVLCVVTGGRLLLADVSPAGITHVRFAETLFAAYQPHAVRTPAGIALVYHVAGEGRGLQNTLVAHPEDSFLGRVLAPVGEPTYGLDARVFGGDLVVGYGTNDGETFQHGEMLTVDGAPVDLRAVVVPVEVITVPTFRQAPHWFALMVTNYAGAPQERYTWFYDPDADAPDVCGVFCSLEGGLHGPGLPAFEAELPEAIDCARRIGKPLVIHYDGAEVPHEFIRRYVLPSRAHVPVRISLSFYPLRLSTGMESLAHADTRWRAIVAGVIALGLGKPDVWLAGYTQQGHWPLQYVLDAAGKAYDVICDFQLPRVSLFDYLRPSGITTHRPLESMMQRLFAVAYRGTTPVDPPVDPAEEEDDMPVQIIPDPEFKAWLDKATEIATTVAGPAPAQPAGGYWQGAKEIADKYRSKGINPRLDALVYGCLFRSGAQKFTDEQMIALVALCLAGQELLR